MSTPNPGLSIEQKQTMKLSPAQLQTIEILQLSSAELEAKIHSELMENPVLEVDESWYDRPHASSSQIEGSHHGSSHSSGSQGESSGVSEFEKFYSAEETLTEHLMKQLHSTKCPPGVRRACRFVIYSLDDNGFIDMDPDELEAASENTAEEFRQALPIVRGFDPAGIAARNLEDCLCLQLDPSDELTEDACKVIGMLREIASGNVKSVVRALGIQPDRLSQIMDLIRTLDPKPGSRFSSGAAQKYILPDVIADIEDDEIIVRISGSVPQLSISSYYSSLAKSSDDAEVNKYLKERIEKASRLIRNIENRNSTIINVTKTILLHQPDFLSSGSASLRPLTMQEVADELAINVSTVSRTVSEKYLKCPAGTYPLKFFFTAEVSGGTRDSILDRIRELITSEDPAHPLSDQKIADILSSESIDISRRTVAKYRDQAGILPTSMRRKRY